MVLKLPNWNELEKQLHLVIPTVVKSENRFQTENLSSFPSFTLPFFAVWPQANYYPLCARVQFFCKVGL